MNMTRRAFFLHPARPVGEDMENAGEWLRRKGQRGAASPTADGGAEVTSEQTLPIKARGIGLRNTRAILRRTENGHQ